MLVFSQSLLTLDMIEHLLQVRHTPRCPCRATAALRRVQVRNKANIVGLGCRLCTRASGSKAGTTTASMAQPTRRLARHAYSAFSPNPVSPCLVHSQRSLPLAYPMAQHCGASAQGTSAGSTSAGWVRTRGSNRSERARRGRRLWRSSTTSVIRTCGCSSSPRAPARSDSSMDG